MTKIQWTNETWNPLVGCSIASAGCGHCYAVSECWRKQSHPNAKIRDKFAGTVRKTPGGRLAWTGEVNFDEAALLRPLHWRRPRRIFVNSLSDLFHESVPDAWIDRVFAVMALCPQHTFQVLTKRSARMREYLNDPAQSWRRVDAARAIAWNEADAALRTQAEAIRVPITLPNVWLGVSVEDQANADARIPDLLATPAAVRWLSSEPLLGWLDLGIINQLGEERFRADMLDALKGEGWIFDEDGELDHIVPIPKLDWIVCGGESGKGARPMHPDWARSLRDQCEAAGVPFFFKQWGDWRPGGGFACPDNLPQEGWHHFDPECSMRRVGKKAAGRLLDGQQHDAFPTQERTA